MSAATANAASDVEVPIDGQGLTGTRTAPIVVSGAAREQYPPDAPYGLKKIVTALTAVLDASVTDTNGKTISPFHHGGQTACVREATHNLNKNPPQGDDGGGAHCAPVAYCPVPRAHTASFCPHVLFDTLVPMHPCTLPVQARTV